MLTSLIAVAMLAMAVSSASARSLRLLNWERGFRIDWSEFRFKNGAGVEQANCPVTLEGSFHSATIRKVFEEEIGQITRAAAGTCTTGMAAPVRAGLPWALQFEHFTGTLPLIRSLVLRVVRASFEINWVTLLRRCTATTTETFPVDVIATTPEERLGLHEISSLRLEERERIRLSGEFGACEVESAAFFGSGTATVLGETERTRFTLI